MLGSDLRWSAGASFRPRPGWFRRAAMASRVTLQSPVNVAQHQMALRLENRIVARSRRECSCFPLPKRVIRAPPSRAYATSQILALPFNLLFLRRNLRERRRRPRVIPRRQRRLGQQKQSVHHLGICCIRLCHLLECAARVAQLVNHRRRVPEFEPGVGFISLRFARYSELLNCAARLP